MAHHKSHKQVALLFPVGISQLALGMRGIITYAQKQGGWHFLSSPTMFPGAQEFSLTPVSLKGWKGDGIIGFINDHAEARDVRRLGLPAVNLSGIRGDLELPRVVSDNYAIGRLGAEHLLGCGFRHLAFYGFRDSWFSERRRQGFVDRAAEAGVTAEVFEQLPSLERKVTVQQWRAPLDRWFKSSKKPVGIMAVHDYRARVLLEECLQLGLDVPHEVAVLGVNNDTTVCENSQPPLSSVSRNSWRIGYEAASLLDQLMSGKSPPFLDIFVPSDGIVARRSTDTIAVDDPHVTAIAHYMHDHLEEDLYIPGILGLVPISRRYLEKRFRRLLNCTPHDYLCRLRVEKAKNMLNSSPRLKLHLIAKACGFPDQNRLRLVFERLTGLNPSEYRRKFAPDDLPRGEFPGV
jgi:LacI family transcriptional regulator